MPCPFIILTTQMLVSSVHSDQTLLLDLLKFLKPCVLSLSPLLNTWAYL